MSSVLKPPSQRHIREELEELAINDLLGPANGPEEELDQREDRVRERYLVGMLAPVSTQVSASEMDGLGTDGDEDVEVGAADTAAPPVNTFFPSSMGLSFMVDPKVTSLVVKAEWGRYSRVVSETQTKNDGNAARVWKREPKSGAAKISLVHGFVPPVALLNEDPFVLLRGKIRRTDKGWIVTLFLVNTQEEKSQKKDEAWVFQPTMFVTDGDDPSREVFVQRRTNSQDLTKLDRLSREENETLAMLYRRHVEFAVGHGISVRAHHGAGRDTARLLETTWVPTAEVAQQTPPTESDNSDLADIVLDMKELAEMPKDQLMANLKALGDAYENWITAEGLKVKEPDEQLGDHESAANLAVQRCTRALERFREGLQCIEADDKVLRAFRFANQAMCKQRIHSTFSRRVRSGEFTEENDVDEVDLPKNRQWRLFQIAFVIINIPSLTNLHHDERSHESEAVADLLWFATGGGKTEAYLGLTAYILGLRRLQGNIEGRAGDHGVAVLMRYTLRLLTLQQFQRAAALICACEVIRRDEVAVWGNTPFRLGLWVGAKSTPNTLANAAEALRQSKTGGAPSAIGTPIQIVTCPWCGREINETNVKVYEAPSDIGRCVSYCSDPLGDCVFSEAGSPKEGLPVMVVDEEIYRRPPSLLIATVDKFAQMPWKGQTQMLFGRVNGLCSRHGFLSPDIDDSGKHPKRGNMPSTQPLEHGPLRPPDLIIQDELHLISGPLGSMVGLYETAIDELCSWTVDGKKVRPKIIASTATIRRAPEQIRKLYLRKVNVFPPQGTDIKDSFFALQRAPGEQFPGRRYLGICAFGRRYPAAIIRIYVAFMAAAQKLYDTYDNLADPWMTLAGYFNSIRELAGTRRLMEDDIRSRLRDVDLRGLGRRLIRPAAVEELTSRKSGTDIPKILERLENVFDKTQEAQRDADRKAGKRDVSPRPYDAVLATNMISVGVDIDRLGLMVVAGQPKTTSEYIQATSRVGRSSIGPGLVITLFNWARPRDLSHYETFEHYHDTFYKHVEALSVTPFAPRALDRGLSGVYVALIRLCEQRLNGNLKAGALEDAEPLLTEVMEILRDRGQTAEDSAVVGDLIKVMVEKRREAWLSRVHNQTDHRLAYQQRGQGIVGLLKPAESTAVDIFKCLNSLRDVEGMVDMVLDPNPAGLRTDETQS